MKNTTPRESKGKEARNKRQTAAEQETEEYISRIAAAAEEEENIDWFTLLSKLEREKKKEQGGKA